MSYGYYLFAFLLWGKEIFYWERLCLGLSEIFLYEGCSVVTRLLHSLPPCVFCALGWWLCVAGTSHSSIVDFASCSSVVSASAVTQSRALLSSVPGTRAAP